MRYLSICSGIEASSVAWDGLGWNAVGFSEIEAFPSALLDYHYPNITNYGDMNKYKEWNIEPGSVDIMVGGTPCQSFSIAGMRKGLADERGGLALVYLQMALYLRPTWLVWENVPGVLSADRGRSFGTFLGAMAELGYGFAYRVLNAQYFGVPQRRRRVFVVGYLGDWRRAAAVLFERASLCGDTQKIKSTKQEVTGTITRGFGDRGCDFDQIAGGGYAIMATSRANSEISNSICPTLMSGHEHPIIANTITSSWYKSGGASAGNNPGIVNPIIKGNSIRRLTPVECERLQGFPDGYTDIPWRGQLHSPDSLRYKAIGNSMAVPVMRWIGKRIAIASN